MQNVFRFSEKGKDDKPSSQGQEEKRPDQQDNDDKDIKDSGNKDKNSSKNDGKNDSNNSNDHYNNNNDHHNYGQGGPYDWKNFSGDLLIGMFLMLIYLVMKNSIKKRKGMPERDSK